MILFEALKQKIQDNSAIGRFFDDRIYFMAGDQTDNARRDFILYSEGRISNDKGQRWVTGDTVVYPITLEVHLNDDTRKYGRTIAKEIAEYLQDICHIVCAECEWRGKILFDSIESPLYRSDKCMTNYPINFTIHEDWYSHKQ